MTVSGTLSRATLLALVSLAAAVQPTHLQCPWQPDMIDLHEACVCTSTDQESLVVQCQAVNAARLLRVVRAVAPAERISTLHIANSSLAILLHNVFTGVPLNDLQLPQNGMYRVEDDAFIGLEAMLNTLNLAGNQLSEVPSAISRLRRLQTLDLSNNRITLLSAESFQNLSTLQTLTLSDNNMTLSEDAFDGLQNNLRTLILKNIGLRTLPKALRRLKQLSFLDLAHNYLIQLPAMGFQGMDSLSAMNLERNLIQRMHEDTFVGVNTTLSSLSLLNNLMAEFPMRTLSILKHLRVLDVGFNLMSRLPESALLPMQSLTLLALDGNPITTLPEAAFVPLQGVLRGLSLGGRFLNCDCQIRWIADWIENRGLQVTSRERNPQFCGGPPEFRDRTFYQLNAEEFVCINVTTEPTSIVRGSISETRVLSNSERSAQFLQKAQFMTSQRPREHTSPTPQQRTNVRPTMKPTAEITAKNQPVQRAPATTFRPVYTQPPYLRQPSGAPPSTSTLSTNLVFRANEEQRSAADSTSIKAYRSEQRQAVRVLEAYRHGSSVVIQWDSDVPSLLGFRVVYRLFGDNTFKQGPPLAASESEFKIKKVPSNECIVVCVVSLEQIEISPETVEQRQCREIRTDGLAPTHMDTFVITASAVICGTIIVAVLVFICCNRRRRQDSKHDLPTILATTPGPPVASMGTLRGEKEWDRLSMYSQRSIPRARMYHLEKGPIHNEYGAEKRSPFSRTASRRRSMADGQSLRSYSALSVTHLPGLAVSDLALPRPELRASRTSLASAFNGTDSVMGDERRRRLSRSNSRCFAPYNDDTDGWTDHDMDIYMTANATARSANLVQL